jgi:phage terminase large subunit-like protein
VGLPSGDPILYGVALPFPPGYRGFLKFCAAVGWKPHAAHKRIARAHFDAERECIAILPRGSAKSTLAAHLAVHHVLSRAAPGVYIGAASREQARVIGGMVRALSRHQVVAPYVVWRTDALRWADDPKGPAVLNVVASSGDKAHGWPHPTLIIADELWAWPDGPVTLLGAMMTSMLKNGECRFLGISTAAHSLDTPLGRLRARALAQPTVSRKGPVLEATGDGLRWVEWSLDEDKDPDDMAAVAACNPLRTVEEIRQQRPRVTDVEWLQFHCCRWGVSTARWLPPGMWQQRRAVYDVGLDEPLILGVDIGGSRSATAVIGCVTDPDGEGVRVALVEIWQGDDAVLKATSYIENLARSGRPIREVVFDPMRFASEALRLERDHGLQLVHWPQHESRMTICSENLHRLVVEGKLRHPGDPELDRHVASAVAKPTPRGWRLVKMADAAQIDGVIALAMAAERAGVVPRVPKIIGWSG